MYASRQRRKMIIVIMSSSTHQIAHTTFAKASYNSKDGRITDGTDIALTSSYPPIQHM